MRAPRGLSLAARFAWHVVKRADGCHVWTGPTRTSTTEKSAQPYGSFDLTARSKVAAHRFAWELVNGPVPAGLCVLHRCDNSLCVNPEHLFTGTHGDNAHDRDQKGRANSPRGQQKVQAKLTDADVRAIAATPPTKGSGNRLAKQYGVTPTVISGIRRGRRWRHIAGTRSAA